MLSQRLCTLACTTLVAATSLAAQTMPSWLVPTPPQPLAIMTAGEAVHILSGQIDANFDGIQDEGDTPAGWIAVDPSSRDRLVTRSLPWGATSMNRSAMTDEALFTHHGDTLVRYDVTTGEYRPVAVTGGVSVAVTPDGAYAVVAIRPSFTEPGIARLYEVETGRLVMEAPVGINPGALYINYQENELPNIFFTIAVVCEGLFGQPSSELVVLDVASDGTPTRSVVELGDTGNGIFVLPPVEYKGRVSTIALIAMNGSHSVVAVLLEEAQVVGTLNVGTTGYDGPREVLYVDGLTLVSTFASDVRVFNGDGDLVNTLRPGGKPEGLALVGDQVWVTRSYVEGGYAPESGVAVFRLSDIISSVHSDIFQSEPAVWPLPATTHVNVRGISHNAVVVSATGTRHTVPMVVTDDGVARLRVDGLANGIYAIHDGRAVYRFVIQR